MYKDHWQLLLRRLSLVMVFYTILRLIFLLVHWDIYQQHSPLILAQAFFYGLRFDLSTVLLTNIPLLIMALLPQKIHSKKSFQQIEFILFMAIQTFFFALNFIDLEFYSFMGKRLSIEILSIHEDIQRQWVNLVTSYWNLTLGLVGLLYLFAKLYPRRKSSQLVAKPQPLIVNVICLVLYVGAIFTGIRGGYQFKPLHPMHAYFSTAPEIGVLTLNSSFTFIRSRIRDVSTEFTYFPTDAEAIQIIQNMRKDQHPPLGTLKGWNVVVFIIESFASEYVGSANDGHGYTPFFDSLAKKGRLFKRNFANGRRSIEALPSILCGLPALMGEPVITSDYNNNYLNCLGTLLQRHGYQTAFFHGAHNGSMHFDNFSKRAGFERFFGLDEYPDQSKSDGYWGIVDDVFMQFMIEQANQTPQPFFFSMFTLSSHQPYFIPVPLRGQFPKGTLEIHESIGYTDYALKKFFEVAEKQPWYKNTLFIFTGDHTQKSDQERYWNIPGGYRVPLMVYAPGVELPQTDPERITQHADIYPTVVDLLGLRDEDMTLFGQSVFQDRLEGRVVNYLSNGYWILDSRVFLHLNRQSEVTWWTHKNTWELKEQTKDAVPPAESLRNLQAFVHYFNAGVRRNQLYHWWKLK